MSKSEESVQRIGEFKSLLRLQLLSAAVSGCSIRELRTHAADYQRDLGGNELLHQLHIEIADRLESLIRQGLTLKQALDRLHKEGYTARLNDLNSTQMETQQ